MNITRLDYSKVTTLTPEHNACVTQREAVCFSGERPKEEFHTAVCERIPTLEKGFRRKKLSIRFALGNRHAEWVTEDEEIPFTLPPQEKV
jgi:hypothetical protein